MRSTRIHFLLLFCASCAPSTQSLLAHRDYSEAVCAATHGNDDDRRRVRAALERDLEPAAHVHAVTSEELERARTTLLNEFEKVQRDASALVHSLTEFIATGDWRLFFLYRDRLRKVTLEDVQRVAAQYLKPANRVLGEFIPTERPDRAEIPPTPDLQSVLAGYTGGATVQLGEAFDPSPQNIEKRTLKRELSNRIRAAFLPKQTRGARVVATLTLHWGDEKSLTNREVACSFAGGMLLRGTQKRSRAEIKDAFDKLSANVSIGGEGASIEVRRESVEAAFLRVIGEEPAAPQDGAPYRAPAEASP